MELNKCDCCGQFGGELETVTIQIKKHANCDVNTLFGKQEPKAMLSNEPMLTLPKIFTQDTLIPSNPAIVMPPGTEEMSKIREVNNQHFK